MRRFSIALAAFALVALGSTRSDAGFVPIFVSQTNVGDTSVFIYTVNFTTNGATETLSTGDFTTLYDVGPITSFTVPAGLTASQSVFGMTAPGTLPTDTATLNLTLTYSGPTLSVDTTFANLQLITPRTTTRIGQYTSTDTISLGKNNQLGPVIVPNAVPEPASMALCGMGLIGVMAMSRRRRVATA